VLSLLAATTTVRETIPQEGAPDATIPVDLKHQYVSGGAAAWAGTAAQSLPWPIDDITLALGDDLYNRMMTDAIVGSAVNIFKAGILSDGVSLSSAIDDKEHADYQQASDLVEWCEDVLDDLDPNLDAVLWNMLDAISYGNKVAELIYDTDTSYTGSQQIVLRSLHVKPRHALAFVVDPYKTLLGVLGLFPGANVWPLTGMQIPDVKERENFVPIEKFAVLTSRMEDNDPRGTSILRGAYDPWNRKQQAKAKHLQYLGIYAMASLIGFTAKDALPVLRTNADGTPALDSNGAPLYDYPTDVMLNALLAFQNGTVAVFPDGSPDGSRVQVLQAQGSGEPFLHAFEVTDREILKAVLTATLATGEGQHASRAQAGVHQDSQQTLIGQAKRGVCAMLRRQVLRRLVTYNYGAKAARLTPKVSLGKVTAEDLARMWEAAAALYKAGAIDESQKQALDVRLNLPERKATTANVDTGAQTQDGQPAPDGTPGQPADAPPAPGQPAQNQPPQPAPAPTRAPTQQQRRAA
jgi:hypothetical protein